MFFSLILFLGENLTDHVYYRDIEAPVVCHPKKQPIVIQELGQTASLSCRVSMISFLIISCLFTLKVILILLLLFIV